MRYSAWLINSLTRPAVLHLPIRVSPLSPFSQHVIWSSAFANLFFVHPYPRTRLERDLACDLKIAEN
mgnify:CR=1 FL=1